MIFDLSSKDSEAVIDGSNYSRKKQKDAASGARPSILTGSPLKYPDRYPATLAEALIQAAASDKSIVFVDTKGDERELTYRDLFEQSVAVLAALQNKGGAPGQAVILQLDELNEFLITFWACVLGGFVPVPVLPFRNANLEDSSFKKLQRIAAQLDRPFILMSDRNAQAVQGVAGSSGAEKLLPGCFITTYGDINNSKIKGTVHPAHPDDLTLLQFTSGSTSFPKGVQISHANVLATIYGMMITLGINESSRMLNWMPFYHDMGLIAGHLMAVVGKCKLVVMKPFTFVRRPLLWLEKIHQHRISVTFSPNFGLKRIIEKATPEKLVRLDLSCLEVILNGAEPISVKTSERFLDLLSVHCGLRKESLRPGYGLAEAGLAVTITPREEVFRKHVINRDALGCGDRVQYVKTDNPKASWFADEGPVVAGMNLRIVDDRDKIVPVGTVGHVQIKGPSVTRGYFANEDANSKAFCGEWLRTGDLGFIYEDRFTITGRVKDVVFVNGQNYYSHDFEHACEDIKGLEGLVVIGHFDDEKSEQEIIAFVATAKESTGAREKTEIIHNVQKRINQGFDIAPNLFVLLKSAGEIPKTTSGKIMRHKLLEHYLEGRFANQCVRLAELLEIAPDLSREPDSGKHVTIAELKLLIRHWWSEVLGISQKAIGDHDPFFSLGGTSIKAIEVLALAEDTVDCPITHEMFKEYDTIHKLANFIARENISLRCKLNDVVQVMPREEPDTITDATSAAADAPETEVCESDIAIIGMGCIFPQADNISQYWDLLMAGRDCVTEVPNDRGNINRFYDPAGGQLNNTVSKWGSFIDSHYFDPKFFNLTENEAITMDPHQRVFLSAAWQAIQDSGLVGFEGSRMGVFVGAGGTGFYQQSEEAHLTPSTLTGTLVNLVSARVSNAFNLKGPSLSIDTACSSSLVAVDLACKSIILGESDTAIAGGVQIMEMVLMYLLFSRAGILSPDGKCYTFSDKANGFVPGEGAGAVVLKRYSQAIKDGDRVYAVIKASAINNDGASLGIMSPNPEGQESVIKAALSKAGIDPAEIGYVEAHGTGTHIGDLIEIRSLSLAYDANKPIARQSCAIGSVKTNMGHQLTAAGIAGLIKTALVIHHQQIPPTLNCENERKELKMAETPFFICRKPIPWPKKGPRRYAAVNSFGFGGTNAHVILGDPYYDKQHHPLPEGADEPYVICLSAKSDYSLDAARAEFVEFARKCPADTRLRDVAYTYDVRRAHYRQNRIAIVARTLADAEKAARGDRVEHAAVIENKGMSRTRRRIAWLFSGQGSQHPGMGRSLFTYESVFRDIVNRCDEIARPLLGQSLRELLIASTSHEQVSATATTQPLVFTMDYALASLWRSWEVKPDYMSGHSIGEYAAACMAGMFSLEDALKIVIKRGALMGSLPPGGMTAVLSPAADLLKHIEELALPLDIAAYNGPMSTVVSGELTALAELHEWLAKHAIAFSPLKVSHAFHSRHTMPILEEFRRFISGVGMKQPAVPMISNVSGKLYQGHENTPDYWVEHIRQPVQFHKGVQNLVSAGASIFLEVGAQTHLTGLTKRIVSSGMIVLPSLPKDAPDANAAQQMALTQAGLYTNGIDIDWRRYFATHGERRWQKRASKAGKERRGNSAGKVGGRMITVPTYKLERRSMFRLVDQQNYSFRHLFKRKGEDRYEYVADAESVLFKDHVVMGTPMLSGAGQCDLICHLHSLSFAHPPKSMRNLSFHQPWLSHSKLNVSFSGNTEKEFTVADERGRIVFQGHTDTNTQCEAPGRISIDEISRRLTLSYDHAAIYDIFARCGVNYGPFHRKIVSLRASEKEVLARLRPATDNPAHWTRGYYLHPGILDSAFQAMTGLLMAKMRQNTGHETFPMMVPVGIKSINIFKFLQDGEYYSHVTFDEAASGNNEADDNMINCNIGIYEPNGSPCVFINRLQLRRTPIAKSQPKRAQPHAISESDRHKETAEFFHTVWKETAMPAAAAASTASRWLVFGSMQEIERQLAPALADHGVDTLPVPYTYYQNADQAAMQAMLERAGSVDGILFLGDYDQVATDSNAADVVAMRSLFYLLKAAIACSRKNKDYQRIRIIRATRNAYRLQESDTIDIRKSLATGFLRTARIEFPLMDVRQIEFGNTDESGMAACLAAEFRSAGDNEADGPETLYHGGKRYTLTVEPLTVKPVHERDKVFNRDKVFWIIGGTSGVGQVLARHLATNFKAGLVLSGSRQLPEPARYDEYLAGHQDGVASTIKFIREMEALGSRVSYVCTDVRSADSLRRSLEDIRRNHGRLDGIYFGALQLDDRMIVQKEWASYRNMLEMRVNGLNELINLTAQDNLDFIVLFSSLAGITGNLGQSDYSASNVFMDHVPYAWPAGSRKSRIITVQWGAWSLGQQVSDVVLDSMRRNGFLHISAQLGMEALEKIVLGDRKNVTFVPGSENAAHIAANINTLRKGLASKPKRTNTVNTVYLEKPAMGNTAKKINTAADAGQIQLLMNEFEKQRGLLMQLFNSQNTLLSSLLQGASDGLLPETAEVRPVLLPTAPLPVDLAPEPIVEPPSPSTPDFTPKERITAQPAAAAPPAPATPVAKPSAPTAPAASVSLFDYVRSLMAKAVEMPETDIDPDQNFMELGADSMTAMSMVKEIEVRYNIELPATLLFEYSTLNELVNYLKTEIGSAPNNSAQQA